MKYPTYWELTEEEQEMLKGLASTFSSDGSLLDDKLSMMIAAEMFMTSMLVLKKRDRDMEDNNA